MGTSNQTAVPLELVKATLDTPRIAPLPSWVKCRMCGKPPEGFNWLKPSRRNAKEFVHIYGCEDNT